MSSFGRRTHDGHDGYLMNHQIALPVPYSHTDHHDLGTHGTGSCDFPQHSFSSYVHQYSPYSHQSSLSPLTHHLTSHYSPAPPEARQHHHSSPYIPQSRYLQSPRYLPVREVLGDSDVENQESRNEDTMQSEPVIPALDGFPDVRQFDQLMKGYVDDLSVKKQDKALIHARRARNIRTVLIDPKDTAIESAQFRFWVKKMFKLQTVGIGTSDYTKMICHEGKPVAIREKLFKILTRAHQQCQHGGRDKTSAQVRRIYSWVPKELISRFVKICPTCQVRRGGSRLTPPNSRRGSPPLDLISRSPKLPSPPMSRRESTFNSQTALDRPQADLFGQFDGHGSWVDSQHPLHSRPGMNSAPLRPFGVLPVASLSSSISANLDDAFTGELSVPSHINYSPGYHPAHNDSTHRDV